MDQDIGMTDKTSYKKRIADGNDSFFIRFIMVKQKTSSVNQMCPLQTKRLFYLRY